MSVASYVSGDTFVVRTIKQLTTNPDNRWANSYELRADADGSTDELLAAALKIVSFEQLLHAPSVRFVQFVVSTWEEDSVPYEPQNFLSTPISVVGSRTVASDLLPLNQTWGITRVASYGRFGHLFLRGCLYELDVVAPAGKQVFNNLTAIAADLATAVTSSELEDLFLGTPASPLRLVMINRTGTQIRNLLGFSAGGISAVPQDHAWYNRTVGP